MKPSAELIDLRGKADDRRKQLKQIFDEAGPDVDMSKVKTIDGDSTAKVEEINKINNELDDLVKQAEPLEAELAVLVRASEAAKRFDGKQPHPGHPEGGKGGSEPAGRKSVGELFLESEAGGRLKGQAIEIPDVNLKTLFETSAGWTPEEIRTGRLVDDAQRPIQVIDVIPGGNTGASSIRYMEETTFTNAAAEVAEGGTKPEAALALTEINEPVQKIAVWLPVTDEQLDDVPYVESYLNNRLPFMVRQRLDSQILVGNGTAPNLSGILDRAGIQTQAKGADPTPDAVYKAITKVETVGQAVPSAVAFNPLDWQDVRLLRTADGVYIWGSPSEAGPERIWGLTVVKAQGLTENTAVVGDFANFSELVTRSGMEVKVSDSHGDFFIENKQAIRAEIRVALCVYRPAAFCSVTGI